MKVIAFFYYLFIYYDITVCAVLFCIVFCACGLRVCVCVRVCLCVCLCVGIGSEWYHIPPVLHTNLLSPFHSSPPVGHGAKWQSHVIAHWEHQFLANINRTLADQKGRDPIPGGLEPTPSSPHLRLSVLEWLDVVVDVVLLLWLSCSCGCWVHVLLFTMNAHEDCLKRVWCVACGMEHPVGLAPVTGTVFEWDVYLCSMLDP